MSPRVFPLRGLRVGAMKDSTKPDYALLSTTTTTLGRVRGFTIPLLHHLRDGPKHCRDLVEITGKPHSYVWKYLKRSQNYGLVKKNDGLWKLSEIGVNFLLHLDIVYNNIIEYGQNIDRKTTESRKKVDTSFTNVKSKTMKQISISAWLHEKDRDKAEVEVVEELVKHYNKTGSKFLFFKDIFEMAERFKTNPDQMNQALMNLKQDRVVYNYRDRSHNAWKIGLYKDFVEALMKDSRKNDAHGQ